MLHDLFVFLWSYLSHWQSYATGGFVTGIIGVAERLSGKQLPRKVYALIFVISFSLAAVFMAWRDQYLRANQLDKQNTDKAVQISNLESDNKNLKDKTFGLVGDNNALRTKLDARATVITKEVPAQIEKQCWIAPHFGMPNSTAQGAVTATAVIVHCNYKIDAPFRVMVEFDRDFLRGAMILPSAGYSIGGEVQNGRILIGDVQSPSLPSEQLVIATVYGVTDQYPKPVRFAIQSVK
jgi:hypothetical protein